MRITLTFAGAAVLCLGAAVCGCDIDRVSTPVTPANSRPSAGQVPNLIVLQSDSGDYIGRGEVSIYTQANALMIVIGNGNRLSVRITGDHQWIGEFQVASTMPLLQRGTYADVQRWGFHNLAKDGLSWGGEARGCSTLTGSFTIDSLTYASGVLTAIDLRFEQHCENRGPALHGSIHWRADDTTAPPGPASPPVSLWRPPVGSTPTSGTYLYLQSDPEEYIGSGRTQVYTPANSTISVGYSSGRLGVFVNVNGVLQWLGTFQPMQSLSQLQPGYYPGLNRYPLHNPTTGGLLWNTEGRDCNMLSGWVVVDGVGYTNSTLTSIDLRFEQHCEGKSLSLHGAIHWTRQ